MKQLRMTKSAVDFLNTLPPKHHKQVVTQLFRLLSIPYPTDSKKLTGYKELMRVNCGEYRIIYRVEEETVNVPLIGKRNDNEIYKLLERLNF
jgi:mRNA interferase RelE/StbE